MRRTGRWIKRTIIGLVGVIVFAIVGVLFVLHTHWGRELVRKKAEAALRDAFPGGATIGSIDGSILGTLTVSDLELDGRDGKRMVFVSTAKLHVELLPLFGGRVRVDAIDLDDVIVDQHPQPPAPPTTPSKPSAWKIELPSIAVHHARVAVTTPRGVVELHDLEVDASVSIVRGAITAAVAAVGMSDSHHVSAIAFARFAGGELAVPVAAASLDQARATVVGAHLALDERTPVVTCAIAAQIPVEVAKLFGVALPANAALVASARPDGSVDGLRAGGGPSESAVSVNALAAVGDATVRVMARAGLAKRTGNAFVVADVPNAAAFDPRIAGGGVVTAALELGPDHARGLITADGVYAIDKEILGQDKVRATTLIAVDASLEKAWVLVDSGANVASLDSQVVADLVRANGEVNITSASVVATARRIKVEDNSVGWVAANVHASGRILPTPHLHVAGALDADLLRAGTLGADSLHVRIDDLVRVPKIASSGHLDLVGITRGGFPFGAASLDVQGAVGTDGTIGLDLGQHTVTTIANGTWSGTGGHVAITPETITVRGVQTGNGTGGAVANASYGRLTKNLTAKIDVHDVAAGALAAAARGTFGGTVSVARRGGQWSGDAKLHGAQLALTDKKFEGKPPVDVDVDLHVAGREITGQVAATSELGGVTVAIDVHGPADLVDAAAWKRLDRKALRDVSLAVAHVDLSRVGGSGVLDGKLDVTDTGASGTITATGVMTQRGQIDGDLSLAPAAAGTGSDITATAKASVFGFDVADVVAELTLPARPFDPVAWRVLGRRALHQATIHVEPVAFDPTALAKLGVIVPYHGRAEATATIGTGGQTADVTFDVHDFEGGAIREPLALHVDGTVNRDGVTVTAATTAGAVKLVDLDVHSPIAVDRLVAVVIALAKHDRAGAEDGFSQAVGGTIEIPTLAAREIVALFGRTDVAGGTVDGKIAIAGTIGTPTMQAKLEAQDIAIAARLSGQAPPKLEHLEIDGTWGGAAGELHITGSEAGGGSLKVDAQGRPDRLAELTATVEADKLDITPFATFAPGAASAARGTVDGSLTLKGLDADSGSLHGTLDVHNARLPLSAVLGTFRTGEVAITIADHQVVVRIDGKLGKGDVHGRIDAVLVGSTPSKLDLDLTLKQISLIQAHQPVIDAAVTGKLAYGAGQWKGDVVVDQAHVTVPATGGAALLDVNAPSDVTFVDAPIKVTPLLQRPPPDRPWLVARVELKPTSVDVFQDEFQVRGGISGKVTVSAGEGAIGLEGTIDADRADIDLLGARSELDHGSVTFDGTIDPLLNVRVVRDLTDFTIAADISGRLSKPEIQLSSDSGSYSQGDLISFFLGGEPSADRGEVGQAAAAAGAGLASALVSKQFNKVLPVKVDINYEAATSTSSEAVRVGHWINSHLFVAGRTHPEARPDENANEVIGEYHFAGNTLLEGNIGDRGYAGLDLLHRWHW